VALTAESADLDGGVTIDEDLRLARQALEHARSEDASFDVAFDSIVEHFAAREVTGYSDGMELKHLLRALSDLRHVWRAAYEGKPEAEPKQPPKPMRTAPLNVHRLRWLLRRPLKPRPCVWCERSFWPPTPHSMACSSECSRKQDRARAQARREARREARRRVPVPA
jgi:hypothetical protein